MRRSLLVLLVVVGCAKDDPARQAPAPAPARRLVGVYPERWRCDSVAALSTLAKVLGATARQLEAVAALPSGLAQPCNYEIQAATVEYWTFDLDCRPGMKQRADALFAQYQATSQELVEHYQRIADAGRRPSDAGVAPHPPEPAVEVAVGAKGLDHHGQGLLFIDDDAPCYVRVVGKDAPRRLELAKLIAQNLTLANAPMTPRAAP
jgi:hypothetical protein